MWSNLGKNMYYTFRILQEIHILRLFKPLCRLHREYLNYVIEPVESE